MIRADILEARSNGLKHRDFARGVMKAGARVYFAIPHGTRATYFGRQGGGHTVLSEGFLDLGLQPQQHGSMTPMLVPADGGKKVNILGIPMVIRLHGRDTGGVVSAVESHDVPGGGPPSHIHSREDEMFQVIEGEYEFTVGGKSFVAKKGATIFAPRGIAHTYRYLGPAPGRLLCVITPAGFEGFFETINGLTPQQQQDIPRVISTAKEFGLEFLPPPQA